MEYSDPTDLSGLEQGIESKRETSSEKVIRSIDPKVIGMMGIAALVMLYMYYTGKIDVKLAAIMLVGLVLLAFLLGQQQVKPKQTLTYEECCYFLEKHLRYMQAHSWGEYAQIDPLSKFYLTPITRERYIDKTPWKRPIGVVIQQASGLEEQYMAEINIITGDLTSLVKTFEQWDGRDMDDIRTTYKPDQNLLNERRANQWLKNTQKNQQ